MQTLIQPNIVSNRVVNVRLHTKVGYVYVIHYKLLYVGFKDLQFGHFKELLILLYLTFLKANLSISIKKVITVGEGDLGPTVHKHTHIYWQFKMRSNSAR